MNSSSRILLWPFGILYGFAVWMRNKLFDFQILKSQKGALPTIVIGNLAVGGTGKTPHTDYLVKKLRNSHKIAILSRGYGRKTEGFIEATPFSKAIEIGDEPLLLFRRNSGIPLAVCEDRIEGISKLKSSLPDCELVILDDAFQHRRLDGDIRILLSDYSNPWWKDSFLPAGSLRDSPGQYQRAHIIIITKCPDNLSDNEISNIRYSLRPLKNQEVFFTRTIYGQPVHFQGPETSIQEVNSWIGIAGIAKPLPFFQHIEKELTIKETFAFPDHHIFSQLELEKLASECGTFGNRTSGWLTTEKDAMRLKEMNLPSDIPMYFIPISIAFIQREKEFDLCIEKLLSDKK